MFPEKKPELTKAEILEKVAMVPSWWHSIDLGQGVITPGEKNQNEPA